MGDSKLSDDQVGGNSRWKGESASVLLMWVIQKDACSIKQALPLYSKMALRGPRASHLQPPAGS